MNNNIKVSLSITLQGSTLVRQEDFEFVTRVNKKTGKQYKKKIRFYTLMAKPAILNKNLTKDAYDYFTSLESCPQFKKKDWKKMTTKERLEYHMSELCKTYKGKSFVYHIFED